jgi:hypothetical protein
MWMGISVCTTVCVYRVSFFVGAEGCVGLYRAFKRGGGGLSYSACVQAQVHTVTISFLPHKTSTCTTVLFHLPPPAPRSPPGKENPVQGSKKAVVGGGGDSSLIRLGNKKNEFALSGCLKK